MCSVPVEWVAIGANVSTMVGLVAAALPDGARVVSAEGEFTSALWPFLAQGRGIEVETVPVARLAEALESRTDAVASAPCSRRTEAGGSRRESRRRPRTTGRSMVDATQACGWLPLDAARFDVVVCAAYKWLLSPRGSSFMTIRPEHAERLKPHGAGWYAGDDPYAPTTARPCGWRRMRAASTSARPGSPGGDGAGGPAAGGDRRRADPRSQLRLADRFRTGLRLEPGDSAIVAAEIEAPRSCCAARE